MFNGSTFWIENRTILPRSLSRKNTVITVINNNLLYGWTLVWTPSTVGSYLCTRARPRAARARRATASEPRAEATTYYLSTVHTKHDRSRLGAGRCVLCHVCVHWLRGHSVLARARVALWLHAGWAGVLAACSPDRSSCDRTRLFI